MALVTAFGVGCFHFGVRKSAPFHFSGEEYLKELRDALQSIPSISNIQCENESRLKAMQFPVEYDPPNIHDDKGIFPYVQRFDLTFTVYIPFRVQERLARIEAAPDFSTERSTEHFRVYMIYNYFFPVTFVELLSPDATTSPSDAVRIVREFLKEEMGRYKGEYLEFQFLGPSPLHGNFYILTEPRQEAKEAITLKVTRTPGYSTIEYWVDETRDLNQARAAVFFRTVRELGFFYHWHNAQYWLWHEWEGLQELVTDVMAIQRKRGAFAAVQRLLRTGTITRDLRLALAEFGQAYVFGKSAYQINMQGIYSTLKGESLRHFIEDGVEDITYPIKEIGDVVEFFETRTLKRVENLVIVIAALLGGVVGSLMTILLGRLF